MLAELAESIQTYLNGLPPEKWGQYVVPTFVSAELCLDPENLVRAKERKLYVMPFTTNYSMDQSTGRQRRVSIGVQLNISVALLIPFSEFSRNDVTSWDEVKKILELREKIDLNIIRNTWADYLITEVDPQPPVEIELNQRNFLSVTDFVFSTQSC